LGLFGTSQGVIPRTIPGFTTAIANMNANAEEHFSYLAVRPTVSLIEDAENNRQCRDRNRLTDQSTVVLK
jgi:hypothetical protein